MRENPYPKTKIPSSKAIDKKESPVHAGQSEDLKKRLYSIDSTLKNGSLEDLRNMAKQLRKLCSEKHIELANSEKMYRLQAFKNQKYKSDVQQMDKRCEAVRCMLVNRLIDQYKGNNQSPLFHNQHGLSPFQMLLLHYSRNEAPNENICMICFMDIELNAHIVQLPCSHILHRQCAVQNLLYSRQCPGCNKEISFQAQPKIEK